MRKTQCILALISLYLGSAHSSSWDFATASGNVLQFYYKGTKSHSERVTLGVGKIIYDAVGNRLFYFDVWSTNNFIYSYDMTTKKTEALVKRPRKNERIEDIAYDPVEKLLFWNICNSPTIYWFSLKSGFENNATGNFLIETSDQGPSTFAIDSCQGYIYWTSIDLKGQKLPSLIERARFDGSEREVVIGIDLQMPERLVIDHQTQKVYWTDGTQAIFRLPTKDKQFTIESADLNGKNRRVLYSEKGRDQPMSLAVSVDSIYWTHMFQGKAWQLPKNPSTHAEPKEIPIDEMDLQIVINYEIEQQLQGVQDCKRLKSVLQNTSLTEENDSIDVARDMSMYCVHGTKGGEESQCNCTNGYIGERCEVPVCQNYCFQGNCSVSDEGQPQCRCNAGYSGLRCEVNVCQGYCLNDGDCSLNEENEPVCQCRADYEGERCEMSAYLNRLNKHFQTVSMLRDILKADISLGTPDRGVKSTCAATVF